ncbi:MAG: DsbE family thiol:disulfide interchange protein [Steroidobacter sp.]
MWRYLVPVLIFGAIAAVLAGGLHLKPGCIPSPLIGKPAPVFTLVKVEDPTQQISNRDFIGHKYLINVWGTWCIACRQEHEALLQIAKQAVIPIIGIDTKDDMPSAQRWLSQLGNPYAATGFDPDGRTGIDYGVYGAPETFLVDEHGTVIYKYVGEITDTVWRDSFLPRINNTGNIKDREGTTCS